MFTRSYFRQYLTVICITLLCIATSAFLGSRQAYAGVGTCTSSSNAITCRATYDGSSNATRNASTVGKSGHTSKQISQSACTWKYIGVGVNTFTLPAGTVKGTYYKISCSANDIAPNLSHYNVVFFGPGYLIIWIPPAPPPISTVSNYKTVASQAVNSITLPSPTIVLNPSNLGIVNFPEMFAINGSIWHPYSASATTNGITASATATPVGIDWSFGDGSVLSCLSLVNVAAVKPGTCEHIYHLSSYLAQKFLNVSNIGYLIRATIVWSVNWRSSITGYFGSLGTLYTSNTSYLQVEQIESINQ